MNEQKKFAVFDIDGTLIRWQLFHAIVHGLGKDGYIPDSTHEAIRAARMNWKTRGSDFKSYEQVLVSAYFAAIRKVTPSDYARVVEEVFTEYKDQTYVYTRDLIKTLKGQGYILLAISGSQTQIVDKLTAYYGFDDAVGATLEQENGMFTGKSITPVHDKRAVLNNLIAKHNLMLTDSIAVGDSEGDIAILEMVERPIAFNPSRGLFEEAKTHGWHIVIERKNVIYELGPQDGTYVLA